MTPQMSVEPGKKYRTPWEPSGIILVNEVIKDTYPYGDCACGVFVGDHPRGYKDGSPACYPVKELEGREVKPK